MGVHLLRYAAWPAAVLALAGCLGDPAPDPDTAPLEVVVESCVVNRDTVAPGRHEVSLVGEGSVQITDPAGQPVQGPSRAEPAVVTMTTGTYVVVCGPDRGELGRATVTVTRGS